MRSTKLLKRIHYYVYNMVMDTSSACHAKFAIFWEQGEEFTQRSKMSMGYLPSPRDIEQSCYSPSPTQSCLDGSHYRTDGIKLSKKKADAGPSSSEGVGKTTKKLMIPWALTTCLSRVRLLPCRHSRPTVSELQKTAPTMKGKRCSTSSLLIRMMPRLGWYASPLLPSNASRRSGLSSCTTMSPERRSQTREL